MVMQKTPVGEPAHRHIENSAHDHLKKCLHVHYVLYLEVGMDKHADVRCKESCSAASSA